MGKRPNPVAALADEILGLHARDSETRLGGPPEKVLLISLCMCFPIMQKLKRCFGAGHEETDFG